MLDRFNSYTLVARIFPAILCIFPYGIIHIFYLSDRIGAFLNEISALIPEPVVGASLSLVLIYLLAQINRGVSKTVWQRIYFRDELKMPTTNFLMYANDQYTDDYKNRMRARIKQDFDIVLPSRTEEQENENETRQKIAQAVSLVRAKVGKGRLLLQHNIEYGFWRNLIGGSTLAVLISLLDVVFFKFIYNNGLALKLSIGLIVLYALPIVFSKFIISHYGEAYARVLFQEYMSIQPGNPREGT